MLLNFSPLSNPTLFPSLPRHWAQEHSLISYKLISISKLSSQRTQLTLLVFIYFYWGYRGGSLVKNLLAAVGEEGLIPGSERSPREGNENLLQYSCLGKPMDRGAWRATVHGVTKSWTWLNNNNIHIFSKLQGQKDLVSIFLLVKP